MRLIFDNLTGKKEVWESRFKERYGTKDCSFEISKEKKKLLKTYYILLIGIGILVVAAIVSAAVDMKSISVIEKPKLGDPVKYVNLSVIAKYEKAKVKKIIKLHVDSPLLKDGEKKKLLKEYGKKLKGYILKDNETLDNIVGDLYLPERDASTGIMVSWTSNRPDIIDEKGKIDFISLDAAERITLKGEGILEDTVENYIINIKVAPKKTEVNYEKVLDEKLRNLEKEIKEPKESKALILPALLDKKIELRWKKQSGQPIILIVVLFLLMFVITYRKKFNSIDKEIKNNREKIKREFPFLMDKIVLLLNSGMVISTALEKIEADYVKRKEGGEWEQKQLYEELHEIERRIRETNSPLLKEIKDFAKRSGVRELLRFSVILSENINKGATLTEKLEAEGEMLWLSRRKYAEEMGRLAETKLTLPLMILLIVFIMITITPALMEM